MKLDVLFSRNYSRESCRVVMRKRDTKDNGNTVNFRYIEAGYNETPAHREMQYFPRVLNAFIFIRLKRIHGYIEGKSSQVTLI